MWKLLERMSVRSRTIAVMCLAMAPLFVVAAFDHPVAAAIAWVFGVCVAGFLSHGFFSVPQARLVRAIDKWRDGGPFEAVPDRLPFELRPLAQSIELATARLSEREAELRTAMSQQTLLMQEIHHRVKNNLQIVASLLNLQASRIKVPAARAEFQSARDRVRALATLHRHLYAHGELQTINLREFLTELCGQLFSAFGETPGARIALVIEAPELQMSSDQAVPLALIVTETVSNSVKFAFPDNRRGTITVRLTADEETAMLLVEDDGVGIEQASAKPTPAPAGAQPGEGRRDGIGLQLIRGFARQLGGTLAVDDGVGTHYVVNLPLRRERPIVSSQGVRPAA